MNRVLIKILLLSVGLASPWSAMAGSEVLEQFLARAGLEKTRRAPASVPAAELVEARQHP